MTQKLSELFNLPPINNQEAIDTIEEHRTMLLDVDDAIDKINAALPFVHDLDTSDKELDDLSDLAKENFTDLMALGMNVEARFSGTILQTAGVLLGHAITAKQAKIDRKLKTNDLQLKKARLDMMTKKNDASKIMDAVDGGVILDRNELLKQILGK